MVLFPPKKLILAKGSFLRSAVWKKSCTSIITSLFMRAGPNSLLASGVENRGSQLDVYKDTKFVLAIKRSPSAGTSTGQASEKVTMESLNNRVRQLKGHVLEQNEMLKKQFQVNNDAIREILSLKDDVQTLPRDVQTLTGDVGAVKRNVRTLMRDGETVKRDVGALKRDVQTLSGKMEEKFDSVEKRLGSLEENFKSVAANVANVTTIIERWIHGFGEELAFARQRSKDDL